MSIQKNYKLGPWVRLLGACALVTALSACGGGDDAPPPPPPPPVTFVPAAPAANPSSGFDQAGNLNYLVTSGDHSTRTVAATVVLSTSNGTLTLGTGADAIAVTTSNGWDDVRWPSGLSGVLAAKGNMGLVCGAAGGGQVGVSHNMTLVADPVATVRGKTFSFYECDPTPVPFSLTFNADGSATDGESTISVAQVSAYFSAGGFTESDGSNYKGLLYAHTANGETSYHVVETGRYPNGTGGFTTYVAMGRPSAR